MMRRDTLGLAYGTGFAVESEGVPYLVTARHNLSGTHYISKRSLDTEYGGRPNNVLVFHTRFNEDSWHLECGPYVEPLLDDDEEPLWLEHPDLPVCDVAALPLTRFYDIDLIPYELPTSDELRAREGDPIGVIGYPFAPRVEPMSPVILRGNAATDPAFSYGNYPVFLSDCRGHRGASGAPAVSMRMYESGMRSVGSSSSRMTRFSAKTRELAALPGLQGIYTGRIAEGSDLGTVWNTDVLEGIIRQIPETERWQYVPAVPNFDAGQEVPPWGVPHDPYGSDHVWKLAVEADDSTA